MHKEPGTLPMSAPGPRAWFYGLSRAAREGDRSRYFLIKGQWHQSQRTMADTMSSARTCQKPLTMMRTYPTIESSTMICKNVFQVGIVHHLRSGGLEPR